MRCRVKYIYLRIPCSGNVYSVSHFRRADFTLPGLQASDSFSLHFFFPAASSINLTTFCKAARKAKRSNPLLLSKMAKQAAGSKNDLSPSWMCVSENPEKYTAGLFAGWSHLNKNNFRQCSYSFKEHSFIFFLKTLWFWIKLRETVDYIRFSH